MRGERGYRGFVCGWTVGGAEWCWRVEGPSIHQGQGGASLGRNNRALTKDFTKTKSAKDIVGCGLGVGG